MDNPIGHPTDIKWNIRDAALYMVFRYSVTPLMFRTAASQTGIPRQTGVQSGQIPTLFQEVAMRALLSYILWLGFIAAALVATGTPSTQDT